ncbi:MAG: hypothetical protein Q8Q09_14505 [Deltaproteobacteria bacterium]|nr:hypothetical protein [Deltaproteobacteria bacterium]
MSESSDELKPRAGRGLPDATDTESFEPKVRWHFWIPVALALVTFLVGYWVVETRRQTKLRNALLSEHAMLTRDLAPEYQRARRRIERLVQSAVGAYGGDRVEAGFTVEALRSTVSLMGRVRMGEIRGEATVAASIHRRFEDQVGGCLGIESDRVWRFFDRGEFLTTAYVDALRPAEGVDRLRFLREDLRTRLRNDTPALVQAARRRFFVLVVDEGSSQIDGPSRLYIWDFATERLLLRVRSQGDETVIVPVRIAGMPGGGQAVPAATGALTITMHDCSLANRGKALLGVGTSDLRNGPTVPSPAQTAAAALNALDAAVAADASIASDVLSGSDH